MTAPSHPQTEMGNTHTTASRYRRPCCVPVANVSFNVLSMRRVRGVGVSVTRRGARKGEALPLPPGRRGGAGRDQEGHGLHLARHDVVRHGLAFVVQVLRAQVGLVPCGIILQRGKATPQQQQQPPSVKQYSRCTRLSASEALGTMHEVVMESQFACRTRPADAHAGLSAVEQATHVNLSRPANALNQRINASQLVAG